MLPWQRNLSVIAQTVLTLRNHERYKKCPDVSQMRLGCTDIEFEFPCLRGAVNRGMYVNKAELIDAIAKHADISKAAAGRALDATVGAIRVSLRKGQVVTLVGFGSFYVGKRTARSGRNPRTGAAIRIRAAKVPKFRAGKALKDALN